MTGPRRPGFARRGSPSLGGGTYEHTFAVAGAYAYFCLPHENAVVTGPVEVEGG